MQLTRTFITFCSTRAFELVEKFCLDFALKCFKSPLLEKRISGLTYMQEVGVVLFNWKRVCAYNDMTGYWSCSKSWSHSLHEPTPTEHDDDGWFLSASHDATSEFYKTYQMDWRKVWSVDRPSHRSSYGAQTSRFLLTFHWHSLYFFSSPNFLRNNFSSHIDTYLLFSFRFMIEWLSLHQILEELFMVTPHEVLLRKSRPLLQFLAGKHALTEELMDIIWNATRVCLPATSCFFLACHTHTSF